MKAIPELLIVENDEMTLEILTILLTKENYHVTIAHDANEAIAIAKEKKNRLGNGFHNCPTKVWF